MDEIITPIGDRLREERARLGLSQPKLGEIAAATKWTVLNWEKGDSYPDARQLALMHAAGVDVWYLITGKRLGDAAVPGDATECTMHKFARLSQEQQKLVEQMIQALTASSS